MRQLQEDGARPAKDDEPLAVDAVGDRISAGHADHAAARPIPRDRRSPGRRRRASRIATAISAVPERATTTADRWPVFPRCRRRERPAWASPAWESAPSV